MCFIIYFHIIKCLDWFFCEKIYSLVFFPLFHIILRQLSRNEIIRLKGIYVLRPLECIAKLLSKKSVAVNTQ